MTEILVTVVAHFVRDTARAAIAEGGFSIVRHCFSFSLVEEHLLLVAFDTRILD